MFILNPVPVIALCLLSACLWMLRCPYDRQAQRAFFILLTAPAFFGFVLIAESDAGFLKFDNHLYLIDQALGGSPAFVLARICAGWPMRFLTIVYLSIDLAMAFWYCVNLWRQRDDTILVAYVVNLVLGSFFYLIVPASGPAFAFGAALHSGVLPNVSPMPITLDAQPNAIPSLHMSTAVLFVLFSEGSRTLRAFAWLFFAGTVMATLALGEHYLIDLVVAVPFGCFVADVVKKRIPGALWNLALVLVWLLSLRFNTPFLISHEWILRICALGTLCASIYIVKIKAGVESNGLAQSATSGVGVS
jgi:hypothetical protein